MSMLMQFPKTRILVLPVLAVGFFLLILFFAYAAIKLRRDDVETPDDPVPMALQDAIERSQKDRLWVALQNTEVLQWDCRTIVHWEEKSTKVKWMDVVVTDQAESIVMVVTLKEQMTCSELMERQPALTGELSRVSKRDFNDLNFEGRLSQYPQTATFMQLCTYCNPNKSDTMIAVSLFCMAGSVILMMSSLYGVVGTWQVIQRNKAIASPQPLAERITADQPEMDHLLMRAFGFTPADLAANMTGHLSPRQKGQLRAKVMGRPYLFVIVFILWAASLGAIIIGASRSEGNDDYRKLAIGGAIFLVLISLVIMLDLISIWKVHQGKVSVVCGPVTRKVNTMTDNVVYSAKVEGKTFTLNSEQYQALTEGRLYYFYYIAGVFSEAGNKEVLSVRR
jgi:hypothetical protein